MDDLEDAVAAYICNKAPNVITSRASTTITVGPDGKYGEQIKVTFTGDIKILTPILTAILGDYYNIESTSTMRIEKN